MADSAQSPEDHSSSLMEMELADESQIVAELQGHVSDKYIYELKIKDDTGKPVTGLSHSGTNWAVREFAKRSEIIRVIKFEDLSTLDDPDYYKIAVLAQRFGIDPETKKEVALDTVVRGKRQWKFMKKNIWRDGVKTGEEVVPDPFAWEKCLTKAERNAKQALIPMEWVKELIETAIKNKKGVIQRPQGDGRPQQGAPARQPQQQSRGPAQAPDKKTEPTQQKGQTDKGATGTAPAANAGANKGAPSTSAPKDQKPTATSAPASRDVEIQKFDAVCKAALGLADGVAARKRAMEIAGKPFPADLAEEDFKVLGNAFFAVSKKKAKIEGNNIVRLADGEVLWEGPKAPEQAPSTQEAPSEPEEEKMF